MEKNIKKIAFITVFVFLMFQFTIVMIERYHDCTHDTTCTVCQYVFQVETQVKNTLIPANTYNFLFSIFFLCILYNYFKNTKKLNYTLIDLKVRINN